jgi:glycosyltransferase involved in cell wall biosynthesis
LTLSRVRDHMQAQNVEVLVIAPDAHRTVAMPGYSEIRMACDPWRAIERLREFGPQAVHIATEGPLGLWVSCWLAARGLRFTTSFHTRFPEYVHARCRAFPLALGYAIERWFHRRAERTLVGTRSLIDELKQKGVGRKLVHWPRGVDGARFHPDQRRSDIFVRYERPIWLYVGRIALEKSLGDFLELNLPGTKVIVGDGPSRPDLQRRYPNAVWRGYRYGDELAAHFASADCFVFPSRTETFGNVLLEALASGLPVASVPAPGPIDLIQDGKNGALSDSLYDACLRAVRCSRETARASSMPYTLRACHELFRSHLVPVRHMLPAPAPQEHSQRALPLMSAEAGVGQPE